MFIAFLAGCSDATQPAFNTAKVRRDDPAMDKLIAPGAEVRKIAEGIGWAEGPVWIKEKGYLLFSDVFGNRIHRWSDEEGLSTFLEPSGYAGPDLPAIGQAGSNGLSPGPAGSLLMADSGNRSIARLDLSTKTKTVLASHYKDKRFNSPNDLVQASNGSIYFTDPPFGLKDLDNSPVKELSWNGVYRLDPDGTVTLIDDSLIGPNGIGLSPDGRTLYVANFDAAQPIWVAYTLDAVGNVVSRRIFADGSTEVAQGALGLPDGLCIDEHGNVFASGPGGLYIFAPDGKRLGRIETGEFVSNCEFSEDGSTLYITSHRNVVRIRTNTPAAAPR
jgi:gluconolactonase